MDEKTLKEVLHRMADAPQGRDVDVAALQDTLRRRRAGRAVGGMVASVLVVAGLAGAIAIVSDMAGGDGHDTSEVATSGPTRASTSPSSVASAGNVCGSDSIPVTFGVASLPGAAGGASPEATARPWLASGESASEVGRTDGGKALVAIMDVSSGSALRILTMAQSRDEWFIESTTGCGSKSDRVGCGISIDLDGKTFTESGDQPPNLGVGRPLGQGNASGCLSTPTTTGAVSFSSPVRPITAFQANESDSDLSVAINIDGAVVLLASSQ